MTTPTYNRDKYYRIMDRAQSNFANQLKRLSKDSKRADNILIYYSISLIVFSLVTTFYPQLFNTKWLIFSSIILSVIVLIYSIINSKASYPERIAKIKVALDTVKSLKREVGGLPKDAEFKKSREVSERQCQCEDKDECDGKGVCIKLEKLKVDYDVVVGAAEMRDDLDFYYTILHLCKQYGLRPYWKNDIDKLEGKSQEELTICSEIIGYIAENRPKLQLAHVMLRTAWHGFLYIAPIIILGVSFLINIVSSVSLG